MPKSRNRQKSKSQKNISRLKRQQANRTSMQKQGLWVFQTALAPKRPIAQEQADLTDQ